MLFRLSSSSVNQILHLIELQRLIALTSSGEWLISGDSDGFLSPTTINARQQSFHGASDVRPVRLDNEVLFVQARQTRIRNIGFFDSDERLGGSDMTIFSSHLFDEYGIVEMAYQEHPSEIVWAVRNDGTLLGCTYNRNHEIMAWHRHDFENGAIESICVIPEGNEDALYLIVNRTINGSTVKYVERMSDFTNTDILESIQMDSTLSYDGRSTDGSTMTLTGGANWDYTESLTLTCSKTFFVSGDVGNEIHLTGSDGTVIRCEITAYSSGTVVTVRPNKTVPVGMRSTAITAWAKAVDEISGLDHLEGEEVAIIGDGFVVASPYNDAYQTVTVSGGGFTLSKPYSVIRVGLPITADIETLDIDFAEGETLADKKKLINKVSLYVEKSRGIWIGPKPPTDDTVDPLENLTELKIRNEEGYDDPVELVTKVVEVNISGEWNSNGRIFIRQIDPVPLTILAIMPTGLLPVRG